MMVLDIFTFFGRMHPLFVHLPIGFLLLAIIFDVFSYRQKYAFLRRAVPFTLLVGFSSAVIACVLGVMLSRSGDYDARMLNEHKWAGISLASLSGILYFMATNIGREKFSIPRPVVSAVSLVAFVLIAYTGHLGSSLTHGNNYITLEILSQRPRAKPSDVQEARIFEDVVHPILEQRCMQCHGRNKRKGRFSMETLSAILKGGKNGSAVVPGDLDESELYRRITLDPLHEDFMPADGKPPMTKDEVDIIRWWIGKGAVKGKKISELEGHEDIAALVASFFNMPGPAVASRLTGHTVRSDIPDTLHMRWVENLRTSGLVVRIMLQDPIMLDVTLPPRSGRTMEDILNDLEPVAKNIIWLNLSDNGFTEHDLAFLAQMSNLEKLRLEKNPISDGISDHLKDLKYLEAVNLNETSITELCVSRLKKNEAIKRIYAWQTASDSIFYSVRQ